MNPVLRRRTLWPLSLAGLWSCAQPVVPALRRVDLQGHRGARGLAPENTLEGLQLALDLGVTTLEIDVVASADGVLVLSHDRQLNADITRDASGRFLDRTGPPVNALTVTQLHTYDVGRLRPGSRYAAEFAQQRPHDGARVPRLADVLARVKAHGNPRVRLAIELKSTPLAPALTPPPERFADLLLLALADHGLADRAQILSFDWRTLQAVQRLRPGTPTVYLTAQLPGLDNVLARQNHPSPWTAGFHHHAHRSVPRMIAAAGGSHWSSFWRELDAAQVREAQSLGLQVLAWTVNRPEDMRQVLDLDVDGVVTDRPDLAMLVWRERGLLW
ncbi:MAG: glycerophosphodiester phosphodiesterase family protein [Hydrogenophaga sp.]|nr:glycerophosphodiester phosphodiesterase family protein [Hydrogenophaga sp.]